jgi:hypothetical protein
MALAALANWDNFYVITGSAAAGLIGLTFVVIALSADAHRVSPIGLRIFVTPTIVHFAAVLAFAAFLSMPHLSVLSVSLALGTAGFAGLIYAGVLAASIRRMVTEYVPAREDWLWNVILPIAAYGLLSAGAFLVWRSPEQSLYGFAVASMLLLFIGIHNAWDVAVWNSIRKQPGPN